MMKLKTNKILTKEPRKKNINQMNKEWIGKKNIYIYIYDKLQFKN